MVSLKINNYICVPRKYLTNDKVRQVCSMFTYDNPDYLLALNLGQGTDDIPPKIFNYGIDNDFIYIPRGGLKKLVSTMYDMQMTLDTSEIVYFDNYDLYIGKGVDWTLYKYQENVLDEINKIKSMFFCNKLIVSPAGSGKTVIGSTIVEMLKQPTLIIVPTVDIMKQWSDTLKNMFFVEHVGQIHGGHNSIKEVKDITVTIIDSLLILLKKHPDIINKFGLLILDECHHAPARTFTEALVSFRSRYIIGLTATPYRADKKEFLMYDYIGDTVFEVKEKDIEKEGLLIKPEVFFVITETVMAIASPVHMISTLIEDRQRNNLIVNNILQDYEDGHSILILTSRKKHCDILKEMLKQKYIDDVEILTSSVPKGKRERILNDARAGRVKVILATNVADEGMDVKILSSVHLTTPTKNLRLLIQRIGRIRRPSENKIMGSKIVDYVDQDIEPWSKSYKQRHKVYTQKGFKINYVTGTGGV